MKKSKKTKDQYAFGTGLSSVGEVPSVGGLVNETASNFLMTQALSGLGTIFGSNPIDMPMGNMFKDQTGFTFANGGVIGDNQRAVEVEGGEVAETPYGDMMQFSGPSHEAGGIDTTLPVGTTIYSDRIAIDGKTMQERKKARESRIKKLEKAGSTPADKNTLERTMAFLDAEEEGDLMVQEAAGNAQRKFAYGGVVDGDPTKPKNYVMADSINLPRDYMQEIIQTMGLPSAQPGNQPQLPGLPTGERVQNNLTGLIGQPRFPAITTPAATPSTKVPLSEGDVTGMFGNAIGGIAPLLTTMANRAGDTPNVNSFENFGQDALTANAGAKAQMAGIRDNSLRGVQLKENAARSRNRNSASSVNTLRALDLATDATTDQAEGDIQAQYASQLMNLFGQQAGLENQQDSAVMAGDQAADLADRQDRDAYFTNLADNFVNLGSAVQKQGKDLNVNAQNNDIMSLLPSLSKYGLGYIYDENGNPVLTKVK